MNETDRVVRAAIYDRFVSGSTEVGPEALAAEHRIALVPGGNRVAMAHPFSGVPTNYRAVIGDRSWWANCAWDAFAILALFGDGDVLASSDVTDREMTWTVRNGTVDPGGIVHFIVPPRRFWDDVAFT